MLLHDDASTDGTAQIVESYAEQYPDVIKPLIQTTNQYSTGISVPLTYQYPRARGKYIAICEGDDYWTSPDKLQRQVDALEAHPNLNMCAHASHEVVGDSTKPISTTRASKEERVLSVAEVIEGGGGYFATNSLLFRRSILDNPPQFFQFFPFDYSTQILGALTEGVYYLPEVLSAHRYAARGSWSSRTKQNPQGRVEHDNKIIQMLNILDDDTGGAYRQSIGKSIDDLRISSLYAQGEYRAIKKEHRAAYARMSAKEKAIINARIYCPFVFDLYWMLHRG